MTGSQSLDLSPQHGSLRAKIDTEIRLLRGIRGVLGPVHMTRAPTLLHYLGAGQPSQAFFGLSEALERLARDNLDGIALQAALMWSPEHSPDGRLSHAASLIGVSEARTARTYADEGTDALARLLACEFIYGEQDGRLVHGIKLEPESSGRVRITVSVGGYGSKVPERPRRVQVNYKPINLGAPSHRTLDDDTRIKDWTFVRKLPLARGLSAGEVAMTIDVFIIALSMPRWGFVNELRSKSLRAEMMAVGDSAYVYIRKRPN